MSFGASIADPIPSRKINKDTTTKVYGRRNANLTIHMPASKVRARTVQLSAQNTCSDAESGAQDA
jgi:hypothetical protein